jgi:hypothetical protein
LLIPLNFDKLLIDGQKSKSLSKFKGEFEEFMIGYLDKTLEDAEDNAHEIDKELSILKPKNKKVNK